MVTAGILDTMPIYMPAAAAMLVTSHRGGFINDGVMIPATGLSILLQLQHSIHRAEPTDRLPDLPVDVFNKDLLHSACSYGAG